MFLSLDCLYNTISLAPKRAICFLISNLFGALLQSLSGGFDTLTLGQNLPQVYGSAVTPAVESHTSGVTVLDLYDLCAESVPLRYAGGAF